MLHVQEEQPDGAAPFGEVAIWPSRRCGRQTRSFDLIRLNDEHPPGPAEVLGLFEKKYGSYQHVRSGTVSCSASSPDDRSGVLVDLGGVMARDRAITPPTGQVRTCPRGTAS